MLAYHYSKSDNLEKACQYLKLAGEKAWRSHSGWGAYRFFREALEKLKQLPASSEKIKRERLEVYRSIANPIILLGYPEDSLLIVQEGERLAREMGDERSLAILCGRLLFCYAHKGDMASAIRYAEPCLQEMEKAQDLELLAPLAADTCAYLNRRGDNSRVVQIAAPVISRLEEAHREPDFFGGRFNIYSGLCVWCGVAFGWMGDFDQAKGFFEKGLRIAREVNRPYVLGWAEFAYGVILANKGETEEAIERLEKSIEYLEDAQAKLVAGYAWGWLGWAYGRMGDFTRGLGHLKRGSRYFSSWGWFFSCPSSPDAWRKSFSIRATSKARREPFRKPWSLLSVMARKGVRRFLGSGEAGYGVRRRDPHLRKPRSPSFRESGWPSR